MRIVPFSKEYNEMWNQFCEDHNEAWFWHTTQWMQYCMDSRFQANSENFSFLILDDHSNIVMAIAPLILEDVNGLRQFTYSGSYTPVPLIKQSLNKKTQKEIENIIFSQYQHLAIEHNVKRISLRHSNLFQSNKVNIDPMIIRNGFIDSTLYTCILDLSVEENQLFIQLTKGNKYLINRDKRLGVNVNKYDSVSVNSEVFERFKSSYFAASGKITRPQKTFELLYRFILDGFGLLYESVVNGQTTGFVFVILYKDYAYYSMSCRIKNEITTDTQLLQWEIIRSLKQIGLSFYELGDQYFTSTFFYPTDEKLLAISDYKRGFGGFIIPNLSGEYFYSKQYFMETWENRTTNYLRRMDNEQHSYV